ncbi:MAG: sigma-70 family RNA polymerase sigma factor [Bacilli bacterium]|nr:sigma-70 family RNA polymerase sigma factor [Bacilli bacterium]
MNEYPDSELVNLVCEKSEEASDVLYEKYKYIVDIVFNKYKKSAYYLNIDLKELKQEALVGFSDALVSYNQEKGVNLATFISLCVERKVRNFVRKSETDKSRITNSAYSLDALYGEEDYVREKDKLGTSINDPQVTLEANENIENLTKAINELLSATEKEVYELIINDFSYEDIATILNKDLKSIYNTAARLRAKIRSILE